MLGMKFYFSIGETKVQIKSFIICVYLIFLLQCLKGPTFIVPRLRSISTHGFVVKNNHTQFVVVVIVVKTRDFHKHHRETGVSIQRVSCFF